MMRLPDLASVAACCDEPVALTRLCPARADVLDRGGKRRITLSRFPWSPNGDQGIRVFRVPSLGWVNPSRLLGFVRLQHTIILRQKFPIAPMRRLLSASSVGAVTPVAFRNRTKPMLTRGRDGSPISRNDSGLLVRDSSDGLPGFRRGSGRSFQSGPLQFSFALARGKRPFLFQWQARWMTKRKAGLTVAKRSREVATARDLACFRVMVLAGEPRKGA